MPMVLAEGYRGMTLVFDLMLDRILVPVAIAVALMGAAVIGIEVSQILHSEAYPAFQL